MKPKVPAAVRPRQMPNFPEAALGAFRCGFSVAEIAYKTCVPEYDPEVILRDAMKREMKCKRRKKA